MKIKPDPQESLHKRRRKELYLIFRNFPQKIFEKGLEVGAGDGYQSTILTKYIKELICTEYVMEKLPDKDTANIKYKTIDAEKIDYYFKEKEFDLIFSSNMIEHLGRPGDFLKGVQKVLKNEGISIHSMPNRFWKISQMTLHHFNYLILFLERLGFRDLKKIKGEKISKDNPKESKKYSLLRRILWPVPHGATKNNWEEFWEFGKKRWIKKFESKGFEVVNIIKGPISSGYSLGFERIGKFLDRLGFSSEYIYITIKKGKKSDYLRYIK